ncbi:MAG: hypothetical protein P8N02_11015 [Actinomycetota bacterium]|jgi:hypothetical protein|nr:hypothetical protein [Actinomycetota bacterium]
MTGTDPSPDVQLDDTELSDEPLTMAENPAEWDALRTDSSRAGVELAAGTRVVAMCSAANRDLSTFEYHLSFLLRGLTKLDIAVTPA